MFFLRIIQRGSQQWFNLIEGDPLEDREKYALEEDVRYFYLNEMPLFIGSEDREDLGEGISSPSSFPLTEEERLVNEIEDLKAQEEALINNTKSKVISEVKLLKGKESCICGHSAVSHVVEGKHYGRCIKCKCQKFTLK